MIASTQLPDTQLLDAVNTWQTTLNSREDAMFVCCLPCLDGGSGIKAANLQLCWSHSSTTAQYKPLCNIRSSTKLDLHG